MVKIHFPDASIPDHVPAEKIDLFLYKVERGEVNPVKVNNPTAYILGLNSENFPSLVEREEQAEKLEAEKLVDRKKQKKEFEKHRKENGKEMKQLVSSFLSQLAAKDAVEV